MSEEWPPFTLLDEAVDRARDYVVPDDAGDDWATVAAELLTWAGDLFKVTQSLTYEADKSALPVKGSRLPLPPAVLSVIADTKVLAPFVDYVVLEQGRDLIQRARSRVTLLMPMLLQMPVNEFARRYLHRLATLYVWGFDVEVHVMCRAVLDAIFQELVPAEDAGRLLRRQKKPHAVSLNDRLCLGRFSSPPLLTEDSWVTAYRLKEDGNDVLHQDVDHALNFPDSLKAIAKLREVISRLPDPRTPVRLNPLPANADCRPQVVSGG